MTHWDDIIVGAGILGLAHAARLHSRGRRVLVLERAERALGASVRNFGMIWPMGQPPGERLETALHSRDLWLEILREAGLWHRCCGSLHVVHHEDEEQVLREFAAEADALGYRVRLLSAEEACAMAPRLRPDGIRLALWSETEVNVDARIASAGITAHLESRGVSFRFGRAVVACSEGQVALSSGEELQADRVWVCTGDDLGGLLADALAPAAMIRSKLQMLAAGPLATGEDIGPMLAAGLTLAHYDAFRECPSILTVREGLAARQPFAVRNGIHVMVSQNSVGELILGDSHHYGADIDPFDSAEVDTEILRILDGFFDRGQTRVTRRWHGTYAKCTSAPWVVLDPDSRTTVVTGVGGAGMTLSFGLADKVVAART